MRNKMFHGSTEDKTPNSDFGVGDLTGKAFQRR